MQDLLLNELMWKGDFYSWSNKQLDSDRIYRRLKRAMGNDGSIMQYGQLVLDYMLPHISDHSPMFFDMSLTSCNNKIPFKFFNIWANHETFVLIVQRSWSGRLHGNNIIVEELHRRSK